VVHIGKFGKDRFVDLYGAPGENSAGYGIYYEAQTKTYWSIYDNNDSYITSKFCPRNQEFNQLIEKMNQWRFSHSEYGAGPFHVDY
jgi:hypothetical protein